MAQFHEELGLLLLQRMQTAGLRQNGKNRMTPPPLPDGWGYSLSQTHEHRCEHEQLIELPLILVMDVQVEELPEHADSDSLYWETKERFAPYWLVGTRVIHDHVPYPRDPSRAVTPIEAACILAQNMRLGSVKSHLDFPGWGHKSLQAYVCPQRGRIVLGSPNGSSYNHHAGMCRYSIHGDTSKMVCVNPARPASSS